MLTTRGKWVVGIVWLIGANALAYIIPEFWWR